MKHPVHWAVHLDRLGDVVLDEVEVAVSREVCDVPKRTGDQVVDPHNRVTLREQTVAEMRTYEPGRAGKDKSQQIPPLSPLL
jgi:hypothetical protein